MALDVEHLTKFVAGLENAFMLEQNLDELQQTVALMQSDNHDEFFDISTRNKKYGRVDAMNGPILLEKYVIFVLFFVPLCFSLVILHSSPLPFDWTPACAIMTNHRHRRLTHTVENLSRTAQLANFGSRFGLR